MSLIPVVTFHAWLKSFFKPLITFWISMWFVSISWNYPYWCSNCLIFRKWSVAQVGSRVFGVSHRSLWQHAPRSSCTVCNLGLGHTHCYRPGHGLHNFFGCLFWYLPVNIQTTGFLLNYVYLAKTVKMMIEFTYHNIPHLLYLCLSLDRLTVSV